MNFTYPNDDGVRDDSSAVSNDAEYVCANSTSSDAVRLEDSIVMERTIEERAKTTKARKSKIAFGPTEVAYAMRSRFCNQS